MKGAAAFVQVMSELIMPEISVDAWAAPNGKLQAKNKLAVRRVIKKVIIA